MEEEEEEEEGLLTDVRREAWGSEQRVVIRPGHLAKAQRAPSSRRSLTRWQELRTPSGVAPHRKVTGSISPLTGHQIKMDAQAATYPPIKGSVMHCPAHQYTSATHTHQCSHTLTQEHTSKQIDLSKVWKLFWTNLLLRFSDHQLCFKREEESMKTFHLVELIWHLEGEFEWFISRGCKCLGHNVSLKCSCGKTIWKTNSHSCLLDNRSVLVRLHKLY